VLSESPSTGYSRQRKCFFHSEIFMLRSYNFLHNARPLARCNRSSPPISTLAWDIFPQPLAHPTRTPTHKRSTNEKKRCTFSTNVSTFGENSTAFFLPSRHHSFPLPPSLARVGTLARTRTQRVFVFCLHRTAIRAQPTDNKRIAREAFTLFPTRHFEYNSLYHNILR